MPLKLIVEVPAVKVPLLDQLPFTLTVNVPDKVKGAEVFTVTLLFTVADPPSVQVFVPVLVIVRLL